jgi:hypothetical protein
MSGECEYLAPWLAPVKVVEVPRIIVNETPIVVYNLMFKTGFTHYANGQKVHNIIGNGNMFVLNKRGWLTEEEYKGYVYMLENTVGLNAWPASAKARMYNITTAINTFVLNNDNMIGNAVGKSVAWGVRNRDKLYPVFALWFQSRLRKAIFGKSNDS